MLDLPQKHYKEHHLLKKKHSHQLSHVFVSIKKRNLPTVYPYTLQMKNHYALISNVKDVCQIYTVKAIKYTFFIKTNKPSMH